MMNGFYIVAIQKDEHIFCVNSTMLAKYYAKEFLSDHLEVQQPIVLQEFQHFISASVFDEKIAVLLHQELFLYSTDTNSKEVIHFKEQLDRNPVFLVTISNDELLVKDRETSLLFFVKQGRYEKSTLQITHSLTGELFLSIEQNYFDVLLKEANEEYIMETYNFSINKLVSFIKPYIIFYQNQFIKAYDLRYKSIVYLRYELNEEFCLFNDYLVEYNENIITLTPLQEAFKFSFFLKDQKSRIVEIMKIIMMNSIEEYLLAFENLATRQKLETETVNAIYNEEEFTLEMVQEVCSEEFNSVISDVASSRKDNTEGHLEMQMPGNVEALINEENELYAVVDKEEQYYTIKIL